MARLSPYTLLVLLFACLVDAVPGATKPRASSACKRLPGDQGWPTASQWTQLNGTVNGRLIASIPVAAACHEPSYEPETCTKLRNDWLFPHVHVASPVDVIAPYFQGDSCNPFTAPEVPCTLGIYAAYSIDVRNVNDIAQGIKFAKKHNIRLVIKNTGHDLLGKSTGKGSLSLWTHNLREIKFIDRYSGGRGYSGRAVRIGAGVLIDDVFAASQAKGVRIVAGTCPTVGIAGGYTSGGGHGLLTSLYGLAADSVLEWEVVTADGKHVVASPTNSYADLYWALSGGGAGTFAVVVSMTTRVYADEPMTGATISLDATSAGGIEEYWKGVAAFPASLGALVDAGGSAVWIVTPTMLVSYAMAIPTVNETLVDKILRPVNTAMSALNITAPMTKSTHTGFVDFFNSYFLDALAVTPQAQITAGRMVPRSLMENATTAETVTKALRAAVDQGYTVSCAAVNAGRKAPFHANAVFPLWRNALLHCIFTATWSFGIPRTQMTNLQAKLTNEVMPIIEAATPGGGAYLNEANFEQKDWQRNFYGSNYPRLLNIKKKYDKNGVFYAKTAVGSEYWDKDKDGRICKV